MEFPWLSRLAPTAAEAVAGIEQAVGDHVASMIAHGEQLPPSMTERAYSGRIVVRTSAALHARLTIEALEQGISLNQWAVQKLASGPQSSTFGHTLIG